jgi:hypothetical protein
MSVNVCFAYERYCPEFFGTGESSISRKILKSNPVVRYHLLSHLQRPIYLVFSAFFFPYMYVFPPFSLSTLYFSLRSTTLSVYLKHLCSWTYWKIIKLNQLFRTALKRAVFLLLGCIVVITTSYYVLSFVIHNIYMYI